MNTIEVHQLSIQFGNQVVLNQVSLSLETGKIYGLIGRNGSGKSVLLKCIAGLLIPDGGTVQVLEKQLGKEVDFAPSTGIVIEQPGLLVRKSARQNLMILSAMSGKRVSYAKAKELLTLVGLDVDDKKQVGHYSMGMRQKLGIAMALLDCPKILLLDEPMSNLDEESANDIRSLLRVLASQGTTILIATHMKEDVLGLCNKVWRVKEGNVYAME